MIRLAGVLGCLTLAVLFAAAFHERYWRVRDCFGEAGRCYDAETGQVLLPIAGPLWGGCAALWLTAAVGAAFIPWRTGWSSRAGPRRRRAR